MLVHKRPRALVCRLILAEPNLRRIRIDRKCLPQPIKRQRIQHLQADDGHIIPVILLRTFGQFVIQLAGHQHDGLHLVRVAHNRALMVHKPRIIHNRLELRHLGELRHRTRGRLHAQHRLRGEHHQRPLQITQGVPAQQVEIVRRGGGLRHRHAALGAHLQIAFNPGRRVIRALALITMGEQQNQGRLLTPLGFPRGHIFVDDGLGAIGEVTKLGLPRHHGVLVPHRITVFKTHTRIFC